MQNFLLRLEVNAVHVTYLRCLCQPAGLDVFAYDVFAYLECQGHCMRRLSTKAPRMQVEDSSERCKSAEVFAQSLERSLEEAHTRCATAEEAADKAKATAESAGSAVSKLQDEV
jgi:hypothetical protein